MRFPGKPLRFFIFGGAMPTLTIHSIAIASVKS
jgi:hypothetical protein